MAVGSEVIHAPARPRYQVDTTGWVGRGAVAVGIAFVPIVVPWLLGSDWAQRCTLAAIYAVIGLSMNILVGYAGQISLGQQAFVGVGALAAANLAGSGINDADPFSFGLSFVAAAAIGAGTAVLLGAVALRIKGLYLALVTLVFGSVAADAVFTVEGLNGHSAGVPATRPTALAGNYQFYLFCLAIVVVVLYVDWSFTRTKAGRAVNALRENESVAQAFAVNVMGYKLLAFSISGAMAGLAGAMYAFWNQSFSDKDFTSTAGFQKALIFLVMVVVGGLGSRAGVVIASAFFGLLDPLLSLGFDLVGASNWYIDHKNYIPGFIGALLLLQTIVMNPGGLGQVVRPLGRWLGGSRFSLHDDAASVDTGPAHVRA
jgi:branched-chain amino acid transport system permease protein